MEWSTNNFTLLNLCEGVYNFTITDDAGCDVSDVVNLTNPTIPTIGPIIYNDTICYNSSYELYSVPQQNGFIYKWSSIANITNGQGNDSVIIDWGGFQNGFYPNGVMVIGYDQNSCPSIPLTIDLNVLNILPVIQPVGPFCSYDEFV